ncbi:SRPBCC family protein [Thalassobacillus hwangdonensis]|uniref:SRPBCC family protein n=1 Tax=Thalassobacillus hwangdonensis TaxID=546108 RepID=A0ABW3L351_9BACI
MAFRQSVLINAPLDEVFNTATDFDNSPEIMDNVVEVEKLTEGPVGTGTKVKEVREIRGRKAEATLEIVEFVPNAKYSVQSVHGGVTIIYHYQFSDSGEGTRVEFNGELKTKGLKNLLMKPLMTAVIKKEDSDHLEKLKKYIED